MSDIKKPIAIHASEASYILNYINGQRVPTYVDNNYVLNKTQKAVYQQFRAITASNLEKQLKTMFKEPVVHYSAPLNINYSAYSAYMAKSLFHNNATPSFYNNVAPSFSSIYSTDSEEMSQSNFYKYKKLKEAFPFSYELFQDMTINMNKNKQAEQEPTPVVEEKSFIKNKWHKIKKLFKFKLN